MARPRIKIDAIQVETLAAINCSNEEIASVVGCSKDTIERRFAAVVKRGRETGRSSLKRKMWDAAMNRNNITMMIWLSKQMLGYRDIVDNNHNINMNQKEVIEVQWADMNDSQNALPNPSPETNQRIDQTIQPGDLGQTIGEDDIRSR